jgi:hypothetical protein
MVCDLDDEDHEKKLAAIRELVSALHSMDTGERAAALTLIREVTGWVPAAGREYVHSFEEYRRDEGDALKLHLRLGAALVRSLSGTYVASDLVRLNLGERGDAHLSLTLWGGESYEGEGRWTYRTETSEVALAELPDGLPSGWDALATTAFEYDCASGELTAPELEGGLRLILRR